MKYTWALHMLSTFVINLMQGSTLQKKPWGQLAPKILDFGRHHKFFGCQRFSAPQAKNVHLKFPQYKLSTPPSLQREGK